MKTTNNNSDQTTNKQQLPTNNYNYKVYKTWLPDFPGFYESLYSFDFNDIEYDLFNEPYKIQKEIKEFIIDKIYDNVNYKGYENDISKSYMENWFFIMQEYYKDQNNNFLKSIKFDNLYSPKEYNFSTDSINIEIELDLEKLVAEFTKNRELATNYIHDTYTSCSGFISYYENDLDLWLNDLIDLENCSKRTLEHKIGAMLQYLSQKDLKNEIEYLYEPVFNHVCKSNYINYDKLVELINDEFNINIKTLSDLENIDHIQTKDEIIWQAFTTGKPDLFSDEMRFYWGGGYKL